MDYPARTSNHRYWKEKLQFDLPSSIGSSWTLLAVEGGRFRYEIDGIGGEAKAGDVVICPPQLEFRRTMTSPLSFHYIKYMSFSTDSWLPEYSDWIRSLYYKVTVSDQERLQSDFRQLLSVTHLTDPDSSSWRRHLVNDVWLLVQREAFHLSRRSQYRDALMLEAKEWIELHLAKELTIGDIAARFNLHPVHFSRRFRLCFGITPSLFMTNCRIHKAKLLLTQSDYTIDHVAQLCGYDNGFYFSRMFKKYSGMTPSAYRKKHQLPML